MKKYFKICLVSALLIAGGLLYAAPRAKGSRVIIPRDLVQVRLSLTSPPRIGHDRQGSEKAVEWKWLQIDVFYQFNPSLRFKPFFTYDDMRVEIFMRVTPSNGTWRGLRWFAGTQYLYKVIPESKNKERHGVSFFMPPGVIYNYAKRNEKSLLRDCEGIIFFYNGDRVLGRAFFDGSSSSARQLERKASRIFAEYNQMQKNPNLLIKDGLWPREMTPWRYLDADRFDLPRPEFRKASAPSPAPGPVTEEKDEKEGEDDKKEGKDDKKAKKDDRTALDKDDREEEEMKFTRSSGKKRKSRGRK